MDLLFKEYASPFLLLDSVISSGRLVEFLDTFEKQKLKRERWDYFIHKLPPWSSESWNEFNARLDEAQAKMNIPTATKEQLEATITNSFSMLQTYEFEEERGI